MPSFIVSLKEGASAEELDKAKKQVTDKGGKITTEYKLVKGFVYEMPDGQVGTLQTNEHINVQEDSQVSV